jgi:hypothetical protein
MARGKIREQAGATTKTDQRLQKKLAQQDDQ